MPELFLLFVIPTANLMALLFLGYQYRELQKEKKSAEEKLKKLTDKEAEIDSDFHKAVNDSINQERTIIDSATDQAKSILTQTQYVSNNSKEEIDRALGDMIRKVQEEAVQSSETIMTKHKSSLSTISTDSLENFQKTLKSFESDLQQQLREYRETLLPKMEKEISEYKEKRIKEAEAEINEMIQKVSRDVFNKALSVEDHQNLIIKSLEQFRKEGIFE